MFSDAPEHLRTDVGGGCSSMQTSLSLHFWEMQGDFDKMQGRGKRSPAKNCQMS
jgi:hypothetical protein